MNSFYLHDRLDNYLKQAEQRGFQCAEKSSQFFVVRRKCFPKYFRYEHKVCEMRSADIRTDGKLGHRCCRPAPSGSLTMQWEPREPPSPQNYLCQSADNNDYVRSPRLVYTILSTLAKLLEQLNWDTELTTAFISQCTLIIRAEVHGPF